MTLAEALHNAAAWSLTFFGPSWSEHLWPGGAVAILAVVVLAACGVVVGWSKTRHGG